jgi:aryl-alcohol dehydrogenase-like predicted oxidoreductase
MPEGYVRTENRLKQRVVDDLADRKGVDGNAIALAWMLDRDRPTVPVVGCSSVAQLEANLAAADVSFTAAERERLDGIESYGFDGWALRSG